MPDENAGVTALATQFHQVASTAATAVSLLAKVDVGANTIMNCSTQTGSSSSHNNHIRNSYNSSLSIEQQLSSANDYNNISSNAFENCTNGSPTTAYGQDLTVSSIRNNVTRVLNLYFKNVSDEYGYGAATMMPYATTTTTTTTLLPTNSIMNSSNGTVSDATIKQHKIVTETTSASSNRSLIGDNAMLNAISTLLQKTQLTNVTKSNTLYTNQVVNNLTDTKANSTIPTSITFPSFGINNYENCSSLFMYFNKPQQGTYCNWTWDQYSCWPPTPAGVLALMHCPAGHHGIDTNKFASRKCELNGHWGSKPNETHTLHGWTDYQSCFKPEVFELIQKVKSDLDIFLDIAQRTRILEIVGLIVSFFALFLSLIIFYNFRSLRNNRTKIHKNLFIAMILQVMVRLTLYLDQAFRRNKGNNAINENSGIENTPFVCEAAYILLEYARTSMFMWMFIEGLYLHNMITVAVFQGRFPHTVFSLLGWGLPIIMTTIWALCTAIYTGSAADCLWNYNLTPYYWILEGPRLVVIVLNFFFLMNIIRVLVMKLRQSQASDIEQTRKAVRAAIVLLPLLGITNLLYLIPALNDPWKFALWSYVTHFLTSFQGFFIALIYCFLNGEVRAVLLKSAAVYMSVRGHPEWIQKRTSFYSGAYNTGPDTEGQLAQDDKTNDSPNNKRSSNARKTSTVMPQNTSNNHAYTYISSNSRRGSERRNSSRNSHHRHNNIMDNNNKSNNGRKNKHWMLTLCFRGPKGLGVPTVATTAVPPESVVFELSEQ